MAASIHDVTRPPLVDGESWTRVLFEAGWRCECTGECGRPHVKSGNRCGTEHGANHRLLVAPTDPAAPFSRTGTAPLMAWCTSCQTATARRTVAATAAAHDAAQPDLFGGDVA